MTADIEQVDHVSGALAARGVTAWMPTLTTAAARDIDVFPEVVATCSDRDQRAAPDVEGGGVEQEARQQGLKSRVTNVLALEHLAA